MGRIAVGVEYDGSSTHGWQYQSHDPNTVQQAVETALTRVADHDVRVICAGRTDAGVHACQQVVHFESDALRNERAWVMGSNRWLPPSIAILWAKPVSDQFHARFSATARRYRYLIYNTPVRQALLSRQLTWFYRALDVAKMNLAAQALVGQHDFTSYRAVACQAKNPVRTIRAIQLARRANLICLDVEADGFLQHMVRNIVGVLLAIGTEEREVSWAEEVLQQKDRTKAGVTAPPYGLYFVGPRYPEQFQLPELSVPIPHIPI